MLQTLAGRRKKRGWATRVRWTGSERDGGRLGRGVRGSAKAAHASTTRLYSNSNDTRTRYDDRLSIIIIFIIQHVPTTVLLEMEIPSQQPADYVLAVARTAGLLRRHARLRRQNVTSTQGKQSRDHRDNDAASMTRFLISCVHVLKSRNSHHLKLTFFF